MMHTDRDQGEMAPHADNCRPLPQLPLSHSLPISPPLRDELLTDLKKLASDSFERYLPAFEQSLSPFNLEVYTTAAREHPYAEKDWYRNPHDIIVVSAMQRLVTEESLPPWLVPAAILHDRGYGILANKKDQTASEYQQRGGAHWENRDTRLLHSSLSAIYSKDLVFGPLLQKYGEVVAPAERKLFIEVILKHDHPLIGEYNELPEIGRHHFDADSLFSISLLSFVKDYLSYCADEKKLENAQKAGICDEEGRLTPNSLLQARVARYYQSENDLPSGWPSNERPINREALQFTEGGQCYPPHSPTAKRLTDKFFLDLSNCCDLLGQNSSVESLLEKLKPMVLSQFDTLLAPFGS